MRKFLLVTMLASSCVLGSSVAFAQFSGPSSVGKGSGLNTEQVISVKAAVDLRDDSKVVLEGNIIEQVGKKSYLFKDDSGEVIVEIDHDKWKGVTVTPEDKVILYGKVDHHRHRPTDIEVKRIILKPQS